MELSGKTVLVTGATGGLGRAIASSLADRGAELILSSRKPAELDQLAASLPGRNHRSIVSDLAEPGAALALLAEAGEIDVLVANAALPASGKLETFTAEQVDRALRVNLEIPVQMTRELIPAFTQRGSGHFVFVSSISGKTATARASLYAATKFGIRGFALCLRDDLRPAGVGVSVVSPGAISGAGMFADSGATAPPLIGTGTPDQVGAAVVTAIERNRGEVTVAPLRQRALARFAANAPEIASRLAGGIAAKAADEIAAGQLHKR
ncbi:MULTISPECIES: SDR family NAD(P)-dependent oxidoreductase [Mycobacterium ulcerans group]|uniref:Conserved short-chain dehydrogenase n=3 Tax=Mycobacterium ulcerans group TaxID=2993898 RepID=B2HSP5_MYCMM|nr:MULTISPECIES: SDR family NAD(P)-dependent oxidoreductase [Mycobacterium ulcerans group]ACC41069.1 conserved short-chain dehydrogenase [Mycobacterium marinum M]AXN44564.1 putative oxidoreductase [Mycobacterium marinum]AXN49926.1 putative oxidoreductase [Mycobacterium marinum]EPQ76397.1 short-chain dehydrogenase [Mycobacterium marinum MB2]EPQ80262.1 short-chain dehydrogenase [Mycobacterium marinum str. Europe]